MDFVRDRGPERDRRPIGIIVRDTTIDVDPAMVIICSARHIENVAHGCGSPPGMLYTRRSVMRIGQLS